MIGPAVVTVRVTPWMLVCAAWSAVWHAEITLCGSRFLGATLGRAWCFALALRLVWGLR